MAGWGTKKKQQIPSLNQKGFEYDENDLMMGVMLSQKPGNDLIQNCDLPPPMKVFSGSDVNKTVINPMNMKKSCRMNLAGVNQDDVDDEGDRKLGLLRALSLSQTRAREAEAKCGAVSKERDLLAVAFMEDSMQLLAYRQLVRLLEFRVSKLQEQMKKNEQQKVCCHCCGKGETVQAADDGDDGGGTSGLTWIMALALCFGIAGFGFTLGCKYYCF